LRLERKKGRALPKKSQVERPAVLEKVQGVSPFGKKKSRQKTGLHIHGPEKKLSQGGAQKPQEKRK